MGDEDEGVGAYGVAKQVEHLVLDGGVEGGHGFVGKQNARARGCGARNRDALALPAGELRRLAVAGAGKADALEHFVGALLIDAYLTNRRPNLHTWVKGGVRVLEHHLHVPCDRHGAGGGLAQPRNQVEQRRLAGA